MAELTRGAVAVGPTAQRRSDKLTALEAGCCLQMYTGHMQRDYVPLKERGDEAGELTSPRKSSGRPNFADPQAREKYRTVSCHGMRPLT